MSTLIQKKTQNTFNVQFSSRSSQRKALELNIKNVDAPLPSKLNKQQLVARQYAVERLTRANVEDFEAARRLPKDDVHYLKTLVLSGLAYQKQQGTFDAFAGKILAHSQRTVNASAPGTCTSVTTSQAHNLQFVAKILSSDVESLVPTLGYGKTLSAIHELGLWRVPLCESCDN